MLCYFLSKKDLSILNCVEVNSYTIVQNIDCGGKSKFVIAEDPRAENKDFVILKDGKNIVFKGIVENIDNYQGEKIHTISCMEIERIFDQKIFISDVEII